ncbi:MAG: type II secretion system protein [Gemmatimonadales bacterium]
MPMNRRGTGLVELVVAVALTGVLAGMAGSVLLRTAAQARQDGHRLGAEHALRVAASAVRAALEPAGPADLAAIAPAGFLTRVVRGGAVACAWTGAELLVRYGPGWWRALRSPVAGRDSLFIGRIDGPAWIVAPLPADPRSDRCPDGSPALAFAVTLDSVTAGSVGVGSPVRWFEPVELRIYTSSGSDWIGQRQVATGEVIQPLAGPLARGSSFDYLTRSGGPAASPPEVGAVSYTIAAPGASVPARTGGFVVLRGG